MTCKQCGKSNRDDATVCKYCGAELTSEPKARASRAEAAIQSLRQLALILAGIALAALVLALAGLLRGCSAANTAKEAQTAATAAQTAAAEAQAAADQTTRALQQALTRIETLEAAAQERPAPPIAAAIPPPTRPQH